MIPRPTKHQSKLCINMKRCHQDEEIALLVKNSKNSQFVDLTVQLQSELQKPGASLQIVMIIMAMPTTLQAKTSLRALSGIIQAGRLIAAEETESVPAGTASLDQKKIEEALRGFRELKGS